eukprot:4945856-Karenia_brevis.AAC.1
MPGPVRLPYAPQLRKARLGKNEGLWIGKRDLSNCFYLFEVEEERLRRQVIGPRIPLSWLENLDDERCDDCAIDEHWWSNDLRRQ